MPQSMTATMTTTLILVVVNCSTTMVVIVAIGLLSDGIVLVVAAVPINVVAAIPRPTNP